MSARTFHLNRIMRGWHGANIGGHLIVVTGAQGAWEVSVDGVIVTEGAETLQDAEIAAELHLITIA